jgi:hypothetical protein
LLLRTEAGTETVKTSSSTVYTKEMETIAFSQLRVGDIVDVAAGRPTAATSTPGTGTVTATRVEVVLPELSGRVTSIAGGLYTLVGPDGRILTVTSTPGTTRFYRGSSKSTASTVKVGSYIVAEGAQDSLTHLSADTITVIPTSGAAGPRTGGFAGHGAGDWPGVQAA